MRGRADLLRAIPLLAAGLWLLGSLPALAVDQIEAVVTITNLPDSGDTFTVNGQTRTWTNATFGSTTIATNTTLASSATNFWNAYTVTPLTGNVYTTMMNLTNAVRFYAQAGAGLSITVAGGWASVAVTTNTVTSMRTLRVPVSGEVGAVRTNNMNDLFAGMNAYSTTKLLDSLLQDRPITNTEPAGGILTGTYPSPTLAAGATNRFVATNDTAYLSLFTSTGTLNTAVGVLNTATGALNTAVIALNTSTGSLNTAVATLNTATGALNSADAVLASATNHLRQIKVTTNAVYDALGIRDGGLLTNITASATNAVSVYNTTNAPAGVGHISGANIYVGTNTVGLGGSGDMVKLVSTQFVANVTSLSYAPPQSYVDLVISIMGRTTDAAVFGLVTVVLNNDGGSNYDSERMYATGNTPPNPAETIAGTAGQIGYITGDTAGAGIASTIQSVIPGYTNAVWHKCIDSSGTFKTASGTGGINAEKWATFWRSSAAVTNLTIASATGNFATNTIITIWGRK